MSRSECTYALSVKQPWAALLAHGRKTIEVRRWCTARRGRILIHAARVSDPRAEAWQLVPPEVRATADLVGGIIGAAELSDCKAYPTRAAFAADRAGHLNDPAWFEETGLYGFVFSRAEVLSFRRFRGWVRFFPVNVAPPRKRD